MTIPLVLGVTGHRDLVPEELPLLQNRVREFFAELQHVFPGLPLHILSPLAEGADQLVADVALDMGITVHALLPMPAHLYEEDFSDSTLQHFRDLLNRCQVIELQVPAPDDINRDQQYVALGGYLTSHSHILLALWDGEATYTPGGTSAVIHFHQHDSMNPRSDPRSLNPVDFIEDESDLVYHITCSRSSGNRLPEAGSTAWLTRDDVQPRTAELPDRYHQVFQRLIEFNQDLQANSPSKAELTAGSSIMPERVSRVAHLFAESDDLAGFYQRRMYTALRVGYGLVLLAGLSFIIYADLFSNPFILYTYLCAMVLVLIVFRLESSRGWQHRYLDYRVLAEALRVQFYWQLAGVRMERPFHYSHDSFHDRRDLQLGWIRHVMRYAALSSDARLHEANEADVELTINSWIRDHSLGQASYYHVKAQQRAGKNRQTELMEAAGLIIVILVALLLIVWPGELVGTNLMIALVGFIPFGIAVRQNFAHRVAEKELAAQYAYFYRIFSSADELISRATNMATKQQILRALGEAALDETSQWNLRQRERPVSSSGMVG